MVAHEERVVGRDRGAQIFDRRLVVRWPVAELDERLLARQRVSSTTFSRRPSGSAGDSAGPAATSPRRGKARPLPMRAAPAPAVSSKARRVIMASSSSILNFGIECVAGILTINRRLPQRQKSQKPRCGSGETKILQYGRVILLITQSVGVDAETWNVAFHDPEQTFRAARQTNAVLVGG